MQSTGQTSWHCCSSKCPTHSVHLFGLLTYISIPCDMAPLGHSGSQTSQFMHSSVIFSAIQNPLQNTDEYPARLHARRAHTGPWQRRAKPRCAYQLFPAPYASMPCSTFRTFFLSHSAVIGWTKSLTSPPRTAISRTMLAEINRYLSLI